MKKLSAQRSNGGENHAPEFFNVKEEEFLQKCVEMGLDLMDVKDFIDNGIPEMNYELVLDYIGKSYKNPLIPSLPSINKAPSPPGKGRGGGAEQQLSYDFYDPNEKPQKQDQRYG